ncbi:MAG: hypothetical protein ACREQ3_08570, partial [Candidatus Binatia bacterium]
WTVAPPADKGEHPTPPGPSGAEVSERPLPAPQIYRVTTATALRDKPAETGQEVTRFKSGNRIQVVAIVGDWLKVESKSNPPKPPGYVWKDDARPE